MVGPGTSRSSTPRTEATVGSDALLDCSGLTVKVPPGKGGWTVSRENSGPSLPPGLSGPQLSHRAATLPASSHHPRPRPAVTMDAQGYGAGLVDADLSTRSWRTRLWVS